MNNDIKKEIPKHIAEQIDHWIQRYPINEQRSGVFEALRLVQDYNHGSLTTEWMNAVADYLKMPHIAVYEVATFYSMYYLKPMGKHVFNVCTNVSCMLNGAKEVADYVRKRLGIDFNETTQDNQFTLMEVECLGACVAPPVCMVDRTYYENVTPEKVDDIIAKVRDAS